jgi:hypothetical protein
MMEINSCSVEWERGVDRNVPEKKSAVPHLFLMKLDQTHLVLIDQR